MVVRVPRTGSDRLGLDRHQPQRRRRADGIPHAAPNWRRSLGRRRAALAGRPRSRARTGTRYPVAMTVRAGDVEYAIEPLFDDQENDVRASSGTIYWEGAVRALRDGRPAGRGYLELTGYWRRLNL